MTDIGTTIVTSFNNVFYATLNFVPRFISGAIVILIGVIIGSLVKQLIQSLAASLKIEALLKKYGVPELKDQLTWTNILAEIARWFIIIVAVSLEAILSLVISSISGVSRFIIVLLECL